MIHDALLILWDCTQGSGKIDEKNVFTFANEGDNEVFGRIRDIAKSHHRINNFVEATGFRARNIHSASNYKMYGLYTQALSEGITEVLQSYKKTLVEVESLVIENHNYTLSYVYSYVEKFYGIFNTLNRVITTIKERRLMGCQVLSLLHQYILNGNERVHEAIVQIFTCMNKVFINQLCTWLLYGELRDPYQEFFIFRNAKEETSDTFLSCPSTVNTCDKSLVSTLQDTECGFNLNPSMIPHFVPLSLAQEILFIGKTVILFGFDPKKVKKNSFSVTRSVMPLLKCGIDSRRFTIWEDKEVEFHEKLQRLKNPEVFQACSLRTVIREIKECVTKHLWAVAVEEAQLIHELRLMKDFFLIGRGELFLELLRLTAPMLDKPTSRTSTRDMNHAFQLAARRVFLSNNSDIEKFNFELPYVKPNVSVNSTNSSAEGDGSTVADGWSSIILKYDFKWPLHLLFTPEVLARYNDMFRLLLRIKKTQHDLHVLWKTYKQSTRFYQKFGMPGILGCIDGTHIAIVKPSEHEERFFNRKRYHSLNAQIVCDADINILSIDASHGGANHDSFVWRHHALQSHLEQLRSENETVWFLGDSGYPLRPTLLTPIVTTEPGSPERYYTELHCRVRNTVERCIGVLKSRWRCLLVDRKLHYHPTVAGYITNACVVLHNIANAARLPIPPLTTQEERNEANMQIRAQSLNSRSNQLADGESVRNDLIQRLWAAR